MGAWVWDVVQARETSPQMLESVELGIPPAWSHDRLVVILT
jgi:hypothetical protein